MKAVNLIPAEERRSGGSEISGPTRGLLGALVLALIAVLAYVTLANQVAERETRLAAVERSAEAAEQRAAALKPYGDVAQLRDRSLETVRTLAGERFDWPGLLADVSRRVPADVTLMSLSGTAAPSTDEAAAATPPGDGAAGPTIAIAGCTSDHTAVARVMDRLAAIPGVDDVSLGSSNTTGEGGGEGGCPRRDQFQLSLALAEVPAA